MMCALITRNKDGWKVDAEFFGYGNANIVDAFKMEGIDIHNEMEKMKSGESKVWNIGWYPNDICHRKYLPEKIIECGKHR